MVAGQDPSSVCFISFATCSPGWISIERVFNQASAECSRNLLSSKIFSGSMHFINRYLQLEYSHNHLIRQWHASTLTPPMRYQHFLWEEEEFTQAIIKEFPFWNIWYQLTIRVMRRN
jgi:hypothetical protein